MNIKISLNKDFEKTFTALTAKYGEDFEILNGLHESQLDFSEFIDGFVDKNVADASIDGNANAHHKDICSLCGEKGKSEDKLFAFNKIFYELKKKYGLRTAKEWLETEYTGGFYLHDAPSSTYKPYCYAYDLSRLAREGLFFLEDYNNKGPKHLTTFLDDTIEFVSFFSNRSSGACGLPNVLLWTFYFWKKDCEQGYYLLNEDYYLRQCFQKFIFRLNQPFLRVNQSAFVNVSIFDRHYLEALFGGVEFPDGTFAIDYIEELIEHQKIFMEVVSETRSHNMFTFPVLTYSLLYKDGKFQDEDFARWCSDHNMTWNDSNFFMSDNVGVLSNCPLSGDTKILYWSDYYKEFKVSPIKEIYHNCERDGRRSFKVLSNGKEINCKINKFNIAPEYEIKLVNGTSIKTTSNHLNKVLGKDYVETKDLTTDDYLPISLSEYNAEGSENILTYEEGKIIGMFLGDGSYRNESEITFSLNVNTDADDIEFLKNYCVNRFGAKITETALISSISNNNSCVNINVNSNYLRGLINQFVIGDSAANKQLSYKALTCSKAFRQGIIDGLYTTDGGNSNRIYTSSENLKDSLITLFASLGIATTVSIDERENRLGSLPNYILRWYTPDGRTKRKDVYVIEDGYFWVKIKSIDRLPAIYNTSYCLEVLDKDVEPIFMLANGIITHNCRLLSDTSKLDGFINSIGGTALSIGSVKVNTINLMRIAYESNLNEEKYLDLLRDRAVLCCKTLDIVRHIIRRNIEKGLLPNYCDGGIEMSKQYCTLGILGLFEVVEAFGYIAKDEFGNSYYTEEGIELADKIFKVLNEVKDNFTDKFSYNIESVPAERAAVILCQKDNLLYERDEKFIYSNQWIPLSEQCTIQEKLRLSSILDVKCSGGAIAHINLEQNFPNEDVAWDMLNMIAQSGVIYFAFNTKINECKNHHGFVGTDICPVCGEGVYDTYQRIVGFLEPVRTYSKDRKREFSTRKWYEYAQLKGE